MITTPVMLTVLLLAILYNTGGRLHLSKWLIVLILNFGMLLSGYLGERKKINRKSATGRRCRCLVLSIYLIHCGNEFRNSVPTQYRQVLTLPGSRREISRSLIATE